MKKVILENTEIGTKNEPYIIAELSGNHNGSLDRALALVDAAADAGAHALKLQTYTADTMTIDVRHGDFWIDDTRSLWYGKSLYELYQEAHTPWQWHEPIMERCKTKGISCFSTPFDESAVDFLESLNVPAYKVASFESGDLPLIRKIGATKKPIIISTGMASIAQLDEMVTSVREAGCEQLVLLKCTSSYPADPKDSNIRTIKHLRELFHTEVGLSDHTLGIGVALASIAFGATVIEKHVTLNRNDGGVDAAFSLEPPELKMLVQESKRAWESLGRVHYGSLSSERTSQRHQRSLYITEDLKAGDVLTVQNLRRIRPGGGLPCKYFDILLGKRVVQDVARGTPMSWELV